MNGPVISTTSPGQTLSAFDVSNSGAGISVASGATFAVGDIVFDVANGAVSGPAAITFDGTNTSLSDNLGNNVPFTTAPGTINVSNPNTVPEPATFALVLCGLVGLTAFWLRRRV